MDKAHPITRFLLKYGYWVRGTALGLILCLMLKTAYLDFGEAQLSANTNTLYVGLFLVGLFAPSAAQWAFAQFWEKITPIKDRMTYVEDEIVFAGSTIIGLSGALFFWTMMPILEALKISILALGAASPLFFLLWLTKATLSPLKDLDMSESVTAAQNFRDETPNFWKNIYAYFITALVSALVITLTLAFIIMARDGTVQLQTGCLSFMSLILMNLIAAPIFIWIGRKLRPQATDAKGLHYTIGGVTFLTLIVILNFPVIFRGSLGTEQGLEPHAIIEAWPFGVAYALIVLSYMAGGFTLSKLYKPKPPALEFA